MVDLPYMEVLNRTLSVNVRNLLLNTSHTERERAPFVGCSLVQSRRCVFQRNMFVLATDVASGS